jgi:hypothetical protein
MERMYVAVFSSCFSGSGVSKISSSVSCPVQAGSRRVSILHCHRHIHTKNCGAIMHCEIALCHGVSLWFSFPLCGEVFIIQHSFVLNLNHYFVIALSLRRVRTK